MMESAHNKIFLDQDFSRLVSAHFRALSLFCALQFFDALFSRSLGFKVVVEFKLTHTEPISIIPFHLQLSASLGQNSNFLLHVSDTIIEILSQLFAKSGKNLFPSITTGNMSVCNCHVQKKCCIFLDVIVLFNFVRLFLLVWHCKMYIFM